MAERQILYKCDYKKNTECKKTACQQECFFTTKEKYRANNKVYVYNHGINGIEVKNDR